ncbi:MAG: DUF2157 domain-containing protein [Candidatus Brocadiia bacterium]
MNGQSDSAKERPNKDRGRQIVEDLPELVKRGVISEDAARSLREYYLGSTDKAAVHTSLQALQMLGGAVVIFGVAILLWWFWDRFSRETRIAVSFLPVLAGIATVVFARVAQRGERLWGEAGAWALAVGMCASFGLFCHNAEVSLSGTSKVLIMAFLSLSVLYATRSKAVWFCFVPFLCIMTLIIGNSDVGPARNYILLVHLLALPFALYQTFASGLAGGHRDQVIVTFLLACAFDFGVFLYMAGLGSAHFVLFCVLAAALVYGAGLLLQKQQGPHAFRGVRWVGFLSIVALLAFGSIANVWENSIFGSGPMSLFVSFDTMLLREPLFWQSALVFAFLIAGWLLILFRLSKTSNRHEVLLCSLPLLHLFLQFCYAVAVPRYLSAEDSKMVLAITASVVLAIVGVSRIWKGFAEGDRDQLNNGLIAFAFLVLFRGFDTSFSALSRGLMIIAVGVGLIIAHTMFARRKKAEAGG